MLMMVMVNGDSDYDFEDDDDTDYFKEKHLVTESKIFGRSKFFNGSRY